MPDGRVKPGGSVKLPQKIDLGRRQQAFIQKRQQVQTVGWQKRRKLYGPTGRRQ